MIFSVDNVALLLISAILLLLASVATYFIVQEIIQLVADIGHNRALSIDDEEESSGPQRRITPYRDRGTVERLIGYFSRQDKN